MNSPPILVPFWLVGEFTTHLRTYFSGWMESEVRWYDLAFAFPWSFGPSPMHLLQQTTPEHAPRVPRTALEKHQHGPYQRHNFRGDYHKLKFQRQAPGWVIRGSARFCWEPAYSAPFHWFEHVSEAPLSSKWSSHGVKMLKSRFASLKPLGK